MKHDGYDEYRGKKITIQYEQYQMLCDVVTYSYNILNELLEIYKDCVDAGFERADRCNICNCDYKMAAGYSVCSAEKLHGILSLLCLPNKSDEEIIG